MPNLGVLHKMIEPISSAKPSKDKDTEETTQLVENVDDPSSEDQLMIVRSSSIADRVRSRKGTSAKATKSTPKRKLVLPTPPSQTTRKKSSQGKTVVHSALEGPSDDDIHGFPDTK